jgi:putative oxidoreductase
MQWKDFLGMRFIPSSKDSALLVMRIGFGLSLFLKHGLEKLTGYSQMVTHFPDPIGIGPHAGLAFALLSDGICSVLVILGLGTRWAALVVTINVSVAFALVHHMAFFTVPHVEIVFAYIVAFLAILIAGPGRYSLDYLLARNAQESSGEEAPSHK